jgi:SP family sugar:H+ symporter-like MFS transporter
MYNDWNCKPWTSHTWASPGYISRFDLVEQTKAAHVRKPLESGTLYEKQIEDGNGQHPMNGTTGTDLGNREIGPEAQAQRHYN